MIKEYEKFRLIQLEDHQYSSAIEYMRLNFPDVVGLAKCCLEAVSRGATVSMAVPEIIETEKVINFEHGFVINSLSSLAWLEEHLLGVNCTEQNYVFLGHDIWMDAASYKKPSPKIVSSFFTFANGLYFYEIKAIFELKDLRAVSNAAVSLPAVFAISCVNVECFINEAREISEKGFAALLENLKEFYVRAFDGDGFLVVNNFK